MKLISKEQTPCQDEQESHQECIEKHIEKEAECCLPWRTEKTSSQKTCTNTTTYKNVLKQLALLSDYDLYKITGCKLQCKFMVSGFYTFFIAMTV